MTAVNPTRLRAQIQALTAFFFSPVAFHQQLQALFSLYANYALRFGENAASRPLIPMYHLPHPVMRQLAFDLKPLIEADPQAALEIADELWGDDTYEVKQTAILIMDALPLQDPKPMIERLSKWLSPELDKVLKSELITTGMNRLQDAFPEAWEDLIQSFLSQTQPQMVALGIQALAESLKRPSFKNLPAVFRLVSPYLRAPDSTYFRDLEDLIAALADQSPVETAYFLKQTLSISSSRDTARLIKGCVTAFPEPIQADLKSALKKESP
jgi:hypothetical protein